YFLPVNTDLDKLKRTGLAFSDIKNTVVSLAGKTILFVDTCHSGNVMGSRRGIADINALVNELSSAENGAVVFSSSSGRQFAMEDSSWGNGAFTKALVEGISGKADFLGKGRITINMLDLYLSERVKELTQGKQTPTTAKPTTVPDFPIAVMKK
ncbi:MAG TPA: caspase family protein, partial [Syntrophorhabdaceae bacterium]|nr:caspase family protein [Syntrophorhabdaceae bacterium]